MPFVLSGLLTDGAGAALKASLTLWTPAVATLSV
jgi:hypothetical protein